MEKRRKQFMDHNEKNHITMSYTIENISDTETSNDDVIKPLDLSTIDVSELLSSDVNTFLNNDANVTLTSTMSIDATSSIVGTYINANIASVYGNNVGNITLGNITSPGSPYIHTNRLDASAPLHVKGKAIFDGELIVEGKNILNILEKIENRLALFTPNHELEQEWEELKNIRNQYMELEKKILEQEKIMRILKK